MKALSEVRSIGIMRTSALGDIIWTLPLIHCLKKNYPDIKITIFVDRVFSSLVDNISTLETVVINKPKSFKDYYALYKKLGTFQFDILLCTQTSLRINFLYPMIKAKRKIGFDSIRGRDGHSLFIDESIPFKEEHSLDAFLGFARYLGINDCDIEYGLSFLSEDIEWGEREFGDKKIIVIHPKASSRQRTWSAKNYGELINSINKTYSHQVILTGGPGDEDFVDEVISFCRQAPQSFAGVTTLKQLAVILKRSDLVIAPDSGPIHLARACGTNCVGLYAAVSPSYTGPYLQSEYCVDAYPLAVKKVLRKGLAEVQWGTRVRHDEIMDLITLDQVLDKIKKVFDNNCN